MLKYGLLAMVMVIGVFFAGCGKTAGDRTGVTPGTTTNTTNTGTVPGTTNTPTGSTNTTPGTTTNTNSGPTNATTNSNPAGNQEADKAKLDSYKSDIDQANGAINDTSNVDDQVKESQSELR